MGIRLTWDNDRKSVLRQQFEGSWELEDFYRAVDKTRKLLDGLSHTVHIILDTTLSERTPSNLLSAMRYVDSKVAPNQGEIVVVGADESLRSMLEIASRIAPDATGGGYFVDTLPEAYKLLRQLNPSLRIPA